MIRQPNVLLMEILFLGSMVMIIIVTNLAWEPISQDLYPCLHSNSISCKETLSGTYSPWLILYQSYLRMYVLGKGLIDLLQRWGILFNLFSAASWEVYKVPLKLMRWILFLPPQTFCLLLGRSSLTSKGISVHPGIIDSDDEGEIQITMSSQILWRSKRGQDCPTTPFTLHAY